MPEDYSELMTVTIEPHVDIVKEQTPVGLIDCPVEHAQFRVFVEGPRVAQNNAGNPRLHVGFIGKQAGANFCPIGAFYKFPTFLGDWIAAEAKKQHGKASPAPHVFVPPPLP